MKAISTAGVCSMFPILNIAITMILAACAKTIEKAHLDMFKAVDVVNVIKLLRLLSDSLACMLAIDGLEEPFKVGNRGASSSISSLYFLSSDASFRDGCRDRRRNFLAKEKDINLIYGYWIK